MQLPFSADDFLAAFRAYNAAIGVAPLLLTALALALVVIAQSNHIWRHRAVATGLALLWIWSGAVYHWMFFSAINPAATVFGAAFVAQGLLLLGLGGVGHSLRVGPRGGLANVAGWALVVYSLLLYPILGRLQGHGYPAGPSFGAPCPMTIFFLGIMLWSTPRVPVTLVVIPLLWTVVASTAALELGILEDLGLAVAALAVVVTVAHQRVHGIGRPAHPLTA